MMPQRFNALVIVFALALGALAGCAATPAELPVPIRFTLSVPPGLTLSSFVVSPDGRWLAYSAETEGDQRRHLFIRSLFTRGVDGPARAPGDVGREVPGAVGASNPFFSPDAASVAYFSQGGLWRASTTASGVPVRIADAPIDAAGGTWTEDGRIVFAPLGGQGLMEVPAAGGTPVRLTSLNPRDGELDHGWPHVLPTGAIVFTVAQRGRDPHLEVISTTKVRSRHRVPAIGQAQYVSSGHLVYSYLGNLMAVAFDADALETRGVPVAIARGIQTASGFGNLGRSGFSVSRTGTLAWLRASPEDARTQIVRVDRNGTRTTLPAPPAVYQTPRLSPDGRRLAVVVRPDVFTREIRVLDAARPDRVLFVLQGGDNQSPAWMPDGRLTFGSNREGLQKIYVASVRGDHEARPLFSVDVSSARNPSSWSRSAPLLALYEIDPGRRRDVLIYRVGESVAPAAATAANERSPVLSPDGEWLAFVSDASGRDEIYARRVNQSGDAGRLTTSGAVEPVWSGEGLFYREGEKLMLAEVRSGELAEPREVLEGHFERDPGSNMASYDADPRGRFFIMLKSALIPREWRVVINWGSELRQTAPLTSR